MAVLLLLSDCCKVSCISASYGEGSAFLANDDHHMHVLRNEYAIDWPAMVGTLQLFTWNALSKTFSLEGRVVKTKSFFLSNGD